MIHTTSVSRRRFLTAVSVSGLGAALCTAGSPAGTGQGAQTLSFGVIADLHYADMEMRNNRYYRDSLGKLAECIELFNERKPAFIIELGDFIDGGLKESEIVNLARIRAVFDLFRGDRYHVLGNHDLATMSKEEFLKLSGARGAFYAFSYGLFHFIVLDGNYNADGSEYNAGNFIWTETWIHTPQQEWLRSELERFRGGEVIVFVHQTLDDDPVDSENLHRVNNAPEIRSILEEAGNVRAVITGHKHAGGFSVVNGIPYVTLKGAVEGPGTENNAFCLFEWSCGRLKMEGFGKQDGYNL